MSREVSFDIGSFFFVQPAKGDDFYIGGGEAEFGAQSLCLTSSLDVLNLDVP